MARSKNTTGDATEVKYVVTAPFQDAQEYTQGSAPQQYAIGDDVSHFEPERLELCISRGLVEKRGGDAEPKAETE